MSDFKAHVWGGLVTGACISGAQIVFFPGVLDDVQLAAVCLMAIVGGVLPDLDSDTGRPLTILFGLLSLIVPTLALKFMGRYNALTPEFLICYFALAYFFINFVICRMIKRLTVHRGIMHSIPFVLLCGIGFFFLFLPSGRPMALATGVSVFAGGIVHLLMDEIHSLSWSSGVLPRISKSTGTAFKFRSSSAFSTVFIYGGLLASGFYLLKSMGIMPLH